VHLPKLALDMKMSFLLPIEKEMLRIREDHSREGYHSKATVMVKEDQQKRLNVQPMKTLAFLHHHYKDRRLAIMNHLDLLSQTLSVRS